MVVKIALLPATAANYFVGPDSLESYLSESGQAPGMFVGEGARLLRVHGQPVTEIAMQRLCEAKQPITGKSLRRAHRNHRPGVDLSINAPKSDSVMAAFLPAAERQLVLEAHAAGVAAVIAHVERLLVARSTQGFEPVQLVGAVHLHGTSRAGDPNIHSHLSIFNVAPAHSGDWRAIEPRELMKAQLALGATYHGARVAKLHELGFELEPIQIGGLSSHQVAGVPKPVQELFSKRRAEIEADLSERGESGAKNADAAALRTRAPKVLESYVDRGARWGREAATLGFGHAQALAIFQARAHGLERDKSLSHAPKVIEEGFSRAVKRIEALGEPMTRSALLAIAASVQPRSGLNTRAMEERIEAAIDSGHELVEIAPGRYGPPSVGLIVAQLIDTVERAAFDGSHTIPSPKRASAAVRDLTTRRFDLACLDGGPGSSAYQILHEVARAHRAAGYAVLGVAPTNASATRFATEVSVPSDSVRRTLSRLDLRVRDGVPHAARQVARAAVRRATFPQRRLKFSEKTLLLITDADRIYPRRLSELLQAAAKAGARTILAGDPATIRGALRKDGFSQIAERTGYIRSDPSALERPTWRVLGEESLLRGDERDGCSRFIENRALSIAATPKKTVEAAAKALFDERHDTPTKDGRAGLLLGLTDSSVAHLNAAAQRQARLHGRLGSRLQSVKLKDGTRAYVGDRVRFAVGNGFRGQVRGTFARIVAFKSQQTIGPFVKHFVKLHVDGGRRAGWLGVRRNREVWLEIGEAREELRLGYAARARDASSAAPHAAHLVVHDRSLEEAALAIRHVSRSCTHMRLHCDEPAVSPDLVWLKDDLERERTGQALSLEQHQEKQRVAIQRASRSRRDPSLGH